MPWRVTRSTGRCSEDEPFAVVKESDSSTESCHATRESATKQVRALYANEGGGKEEKYESDGD